MSVAIIVGVFYIKVYIPKSTYETIEPTVGDLQVTVQGIGNVSALNIYSITAQTGGKILKLLVDDGDWVKKGDLLVVMDGVDLPQQLDVAKANLTKTSYDITASENELQNLKAQKELLQITYSRYAKLKEQGFASQSEYDKADAELKSVNANIAVAASRINSAKAALVVAEKNRDVIKTKIDRLKVLSPIDGYVISKSAEVAQNVLPSTPILTIVDPKTLWVETKIDERISSQIKIAQSATIILRSQPQKLYKGSVKRILSMSDAVTLEREVDVAFETLPTPFYINEQAQVHIVVQNLSGVVKIPTKVVVQKDGELGVWLVENGRAKFQVIEKIAQNDTEIAISNIDKASHIIVPNTKKKPLSDGAKVH
jgi:RND family efflux transporter MFP subunit